MKILGTLGAFALCAGLASGAQAGWFYQFDASSSVSGDNYGSFTYSSDTPITGYTLVNAADLDSCSNTVPAGGCNYVQFWPDYDGSHDTVWFNGSGPGSTVYYFALNALSTVGSYDSQVFGDLQAAHLTVSFTPDGGVPEPASWALMLGGFGLIGAALRGRRAARPSIA
jgi:hypothetical protein